MGTRKRVVARDTFGQVRCHGAGDRVLADGDYQRNQVMLAIWTVELGT